MDDKVIQDAELEQLLEDRELAKKAIASYNKIDKDARVKIEAAEIQPPYRIGRFIIAKSKTPPRSVSFETGESTRISIKLLG